jgi:hypothetical protein
MREAQIMQEAAASEEKLKSALDLVMMKQKKKTESKAAN